MLALGVGASLLAAVTRGAPRAPQPVQVATPSLRHTDAWRQPPPVADLGEFFRLVRRFHPPGPAAQRPTPPNGPTRLPLAGFQVAAIATDDTGDVILLTSKDPAHGEAYVFDRGRSDRDAELVSVRRDAKSLYVRVKRGEESFEFVSPRKTMNWLAGDGFRYLASASQNQDRASLQKHAALKGVPFFEDGKIVGLRVTGVRPGSWAQHMGVKRNDIVRRVDGTAISSALHAKIQLQQSVVQRLSVTRVTNGSPTAVQLSRS